MSEYKFACPHCGQVQQEPASAYSTTCKACQQHYRVQEVLHPSAAPIPPAIEQRRVTCFQCAHDLTVAAAAQSTICGSLVPSGGHNILEPAVAGKPVVVGPHMENFQEIADQFRADDALVQVGSVDELAGEVSSLLLDEPRQRRLGERARELVGRNRGAVRAAPTRSPASSGEAAAGNALRRRRRCPAAYRRGWRRRTRLAAAGWGTGHGPWCGSKGAARRTVEALAELLT